VSHAINLVAVLGVREHCIARRRVLLTKGHYHFLTQIGNAQLIEVKRQVGHLGCIHRHDVGVEQEGAKIDVGQVVECPLVARQLAFVQ